MKKFIVAILALFYLSVSTGLVFNMHYCKGDLAGVAIGPFSHNSCACKSDNAKGDKVKTETKGGNDCCKDELNIVKIESDQHHSHVANVDFSFFPTIPSSGFELDFLTLTEEPNLVPFSYAYHPPPTGVPLYVKNNVFRI